MEKSQRQVQRFVQQLTLSLESIDAFDKFVEDWYAQGGDKITEEVNEWYQSVK